MRGGKTAPSALPQARAAWANGNRAAEGHAAVTETKGLQQHKKRKDPQHRAVSEPTPLHIRFPRTRQRSLLNSAA